jgi:hypothetical protein
MFNASELVVRSVLVGVGATLLVDAWSLVLQHFGVSSLRLALLGRWVGHFPRGRFRHDDIKRATPVPHEALLGWCTHYAIGIGFAAVLLVVAGPAWALSPTLPAALGLGVVTVLCPWLVLQPALGAGVASSRTPKPLFNALKSLITHTVFGIGLFLAAKAVALLF